MKIRNIAAAVYPAARNVTLTLIGDGDAYCLSRKGFKLRGGALVRGAGLVRDERFTTVPQNVSRAYYSQGNKSLFVETDEGLYVYNSLPTFKNFRKICDPVESPSFFADYRNNGLYITTLYSGTRRIGFSGYASGETEEEYGFYTGVMHCGRLFARDISDGLKIRWSSFHPLQWDEGIDGSGYVQLTADGGDVLRLIAYGEKIAAIRERGVTVLRAYGEPQHFKAEATADYLTADGIIPETCAVCAGEIFFCTQSGIFSFDGSTVQRRENDGESDISAYLSATAYGDRYYLFCNSLTHGDGALYVYEPTEKSGYYAGWKPDCLAVCGELTAFFGDGIYTVTEGAGEGEWISRAVDFGSASFKYLREVTVDGDGELSLAVSADGVTRKFSGCGRFKAGLCGRSFVFTVSGAGGVRRLEAAAEVRDGI